MNFASGVWLLVMDASAFDGADCLYVANGLFLVKKSAH